EKFRDHWCAIGGKTGLKTDWFATWRNFCLSEAEFIARTTRVQAAGAAAAPWWSSEPLIAAEGIKHGLTPLPGEDMFTFKGRVQVAMTRPAKPAGPQPASMPPIKAPEPEKQRVFESPEAIAARTAEIQKARRLIRQSPDRLAVAALSPGPRSTIAGGKGTAGMPCAPGRGQSAVASAARASMLAMLKK
ncbi:hypothetical protein AAKU55_005782, partial [Oxalobacteraceae bacterium GrIS 1.11]